MSEGESKDSSGSECPVCYERLRDLEGAGRTLSCGHVFCHDCLVKYLLSTRVDGQVQRTIVCPVCRYVTFLSKKSCARQGRYCHFTWGPHLCWGSLLRTLEEPLVGACLGSKPFRSSYFLLIKAH